MNEELLFSGFGVAIILYVFVSIFVLVVLDREGFNYSILNTVFTNYGSLRKLVKKKGKYKCLYITYLITTLLPILIFVLFVMQAFCNI